MQDDPIPGTPGEHHSPEPHPEDSMPIAELDARARADAAMRRIAAGGDPAQEAFDLANAFTDETTARFRLRLGRIFRRR